MSENMGSDIDNVINALTNLKPRLGEYSILNQKIQEARTELQNLQAAYSRLKLECDTNITNLAAKQADMSKQHDAMITNKVERIKELDKGVIAGEAKLAELQSMISTRKLEHDQIEASFSSLKKRLA